MLTLMEVLLILRRFRQNSKCDEDIQQIKREVTSWHLDSDRTETSENHILNKRMESLVLENKALKS